jgi:hypothetical protein
MSKIAKYLCLFFATLLLGFVMSGADAPIALYLGYFGFGYLAPVYLLRAGRENLALLAWTVLLIVFAFVFESDRMMWPDYRPTRDGISVLAAVPILALVLRCGFLLVDRLMRTEAKVAQLATAQAYDARVGARVSKAALSSTARTDKAYGPLIGLWLLWPLGILISAVLDGNRWDRMRYDNSLLLGMFVPPLVATLGFFIYRYFRNRAQARRAEALTVQTAEPPAQTEISGPDGRAR